MKLTTVLSFLLLSTAAATETSLRHRRLTEVDSETHHRHLVDVGKLRGSALRELDETAESFTNDPSAYAATDEAI
jgi:hypothetical protein